MKKLKILFGLSIVSFQLFAQNYQGINGLNRGGVQGSFSNPAKLINDASYFSLNLLSGNIHVNNNAFKFDRDSILSGNYEIIDTNLTDPVSYAAPIFNVALPSFHIKLKNKFAFGFSSRVRFMNQLDNMNPDWIRLIEENVGGNYTKAVDDPIGFNINIHALSDWGISGAYKVIDIPKISLSVGATARFYSGLGYFNFQNKGMKGQYYDVFGQELVQIDNIDWNLSSSISDFTEFEQGFSSMQDVFQSVFGNSTAGKGIGGDIGAELLIKPLLPMSKKPYLARVGASITDIGSINYKNVQQLKISGNGIANVDSIAKYYTDFDALENQFIGNFVISNTFQDIRTGLPTMLNVYGDFCLTKRFFLHVFAQGNLKSKTDINPRFYNALTLAPRFETRLFDAILPITYNNMSKDIKAGLALRFTYLTLGSDDLNVLFTDTKGTNFYFKLQFHLGKKNKNTETVSE